MIRISFPISKLELSNQTLKVKFLLTCDHTHYEINESQSHFIVAIALTELRMPAHTSL